MDEVINDIVIAKRLVQVFSHNQFITVVQKKKKNRTLSLKTLNSYGVVDQTRIISDKNPGYLL